MHDGEGPGVAYAVERVRRMAFPNVQVTAPAAGIRFEHDVAVMMRDGAALRVNVFRPDSGGTFPVLVSAHPYGKDVLPKRTPFGYAPVQRYRFIRQPERVTFSALTTWEAPDPSHWVPRGYVVVNVDLRGFGASDGIGALLSDQEAADYAQVIEWAAAQPWSTGKVGLFGVSYLAISQWKAAALRPKSLAAICPWEGFTDFYRDVAYPGGVREDGFVPFWGGQMDRAGRTSMSLRREQLARPLRDDFWAAAAPALERIEVPALICASFSDHGLHTRGCFEAFRRVGSKDRFVYTHRGGKWSTFYSPDALDFQARFFDCYLKGSDGGMRGAAPVRLEVRASGDSVHAVRLERGWPLPSTRWTPLHLGPGALRPSPWSTSATSRFPARRGRASFILPILDDFELSGPMKLKLFVELVGARDANLFVAVRKLASSGRPVVFEGAYGFGFDVVSKGWLRVALRRLDEASSEPHRPVLSCDREEPLEPGRIAPVEIELLPSSTLFQRGEALRLDIQGRWLWPRSPFFGTFPAGYAPSAAGDVVLHLGGQHDAHLLAPLTAGLIRGLL
jgi:predicted acyl esterase